MASTTFTDRKGRVWDVSLDLRKAHEIDQGDYTEYGIPAGEFSILRPERDLFKRVLFDAPFLFAIIWRMVSGQAEKMSRVSFPISPKESPDEAILEFVSGVNGPTIEAARQAFVEAISDFFPDSRIGLSMLMKQIRKAGEKIGEKMSKVEPMLEEYLEKELEKGIADLRKQLHSGKRGGKSSESPATPV